MSPRPFLVAALSFFSLSAVAALSFEPPERRAAMPFGDLPPADSLEPPPTEPRLRRASHRVATGETIGNILGRYQVTLDPIRKAAIEIHDLARLRPGHDLHFTWVNDEAELRELRYTLDEDRTLIVVRDEAGWHGRLDEVQYEVRTGVREFTVESSLWADAIDAGLRPADIASLAEVFDCDIDFNTEVQRGARATMVVDEKWTDGAMKKLGAPGAVRFENGGKTYLAIRHTRADGSTAYYDADGNARKKAFLRSPLAFSNVTSGFNLKRFHPVLKTTRPHYGTDFGAPTGTPVRAVADGVVVTAGRSGGHGNFVKLDHDGPFASSYSHLSKISVKNGQKIKQGDKVGEVGATGLATGPHLHFQMWNGSSFINPMTADLPRTEPLPAEEMVLFQATRDRLLAMLDKAELASAE